MDLPTDNKNLIFLILYWLKFDIMALNLQSGQKLLLQVAGTSAAIIAVFSVYTFYKNNIWHPKVIVEEVDFKNGIAKMMINGKKFTLKGDSSYLIAFDWGVKFGYTYTSDGKRVYDRIEILKRNMVHSVIKKADGVEELGFVGDEDNYYDNVFAAFAGNPKNENVTW